MTAQTEQAIATLATVSRLLAGDPDAAEVRNLADAVVAKLTTRRREIVLFGKRPEPTAKRGDVVEIRKVKAPTDDTAPARSAWQAVRDQAATMRAAHPAMGEAAAFRAVLAKRPDLLDRCRGDFDYLAAPTAPTPDAGALTVADVAMGEINTIAARLKRADPTLTQEGAVAKAMATPAGRAAYAKYRSPDRHRTALELAAITKRAVAVADRLRKWGAASCVQFIEDRRREVDADAVRSVERMSAAYAVVATAFPAEWAASRAGK